MIRQTLLVAAVLGFATPALSLSCLQPDVKRSFQTALEAKEQYIVVNGILSFDESRLPEAVGNESPDSTRIPARFEGSALSKTGFDVAFNRDITLDVLCYGPWCGSAASGIDYLAFLQLQNDRWVMIEDPCGSMSFAKPSDETLSTVVQCYRDEMCDN